MEKTIKKTFEYEISITKDSYELKTPPTIEDEMAALIIVNMLLGYSKDQVLETINNAKGNQKNALQDMLGKINSAKSVVQLMGSDYAREIMLMTDKNLADETNLAEQEPIMGLEDVAKLNNK